MLNELFEWLFGSEQKIKRKVFISFAIEDKKYRDFLISQSKNQRSPFEFTDMSVKKPWSESEWKKQCKKRILECDSMIVLLSKNTWHSSGTRWEIKCGRKLNIRMIGMHVRKDNKGAIPPELANKRVIEWSWEGLEKFLN